jgi:prefoldin subunit 5
MNHLVERLRGGEDSLEYAAADEIEELEARIAELEAALRHLDDMIVDLDAGHMELYQVSRFINAALEGKKDE